MSWTKELRETARFPFGFAFLRHPKERLEAVIPAAGDATFLAAENGLAPAVYWVTPAGSETPEFSGRN